jgi:hypothetical protein
MVPMVVVLLPSIAFVSALGRNRVMKRLIHPMKNLL